MSGRNAVHTNGPVAVRAGRVRGLALATVAALAVALGAGSATPATADANFDQAKQRSGWNGFSSNGRCCYYVDYQNNWYFRTGGWVQKFIPGLGWTGRVDFWAASGYHNPF